LGRVMCQNQIGRSLCAWWRWPKVATEERCRESRFTH